MKAGKPPPLPTRRRASSPAGPAVAASAFGVPAHSSAAGALRDLPVDAIVANPAQPRRRFDPDDLAALATSISQRGLLQPIVVRPLDDARYELVAGERRWRATQLAGLPSIPSVVRHRDDVTALTDALIENVARRDLTPVEEARALRLLIDDLGVSHRELAAQLGGRSRPDITNTMRLLELPDDVLDLIDAGKLTKGHGKVLLAVAAPATVGQLAAQAAQGGWSVRRLESTVHQQAQPRVPSAPRVPDGRRRAAARLTATLAGSYAGAEVVARRDGFALRVPVETLGAAEELVRRLAAPDLSRDGP